MPQAAPPSFRSARKRPLRRCRWRRRRGGAHGSLECCGVARICRPSSVLRPTAIRMVRYTAPFALARSLCLLAARAAGVLPIDAVFTDFRDPDGACARGRRGAPRRLWRQGRHPSLADRDHQQGIHLHASRARLGATRGRALWKPAAPVLHNSTASCSMRRIWRRPNASWPPHHRVINPDGAASTA